MQEVSERGNGQTEIQEVVNPEEIYRGRQRRQRQPVNPPEPVREEPTDFDTSAKPAKRGSGGALSLQGSWSKIIVGVILAVIVSLLITSQQMLSKSDFEKNINGLVSSVGAVQTDMKTVKDNLNTGLAGIPGQISTATNAQFADIATKLQNDEATLATIQTQVNAAAANVVDVSNLQKSINDTSASISALQTALADETAKVGTQNTTLTTLQTTLTTLQATVTKLQADVVALQAGTGTDTDTGTPTPTTNTVTATSYNSPMIFSGIKAAGSSRSFGLKIANTTAKDLAYVNLTVTILSPVNPATYFAQDPALMSNSGSFAWTYNPGTGNKMTFTGEGFVYVSDSGELADLQTLHIYSNEDMTGTYTMSVTGVVINSKTLQ